MSSKLAERFWWLTKLIVCSVCICYVCDMGSPILDLVDEKELIIGNVVNKKVS